MDFEPTGSPFSPRSYPPPDRSRANGTAKVRQKTPLIVASGDARSQTPRRKKSAARAAELAGEQIDKMGDVATTAEERQTRKRRLIKGPKEFRDGRTDQPKSKGK